MSDWQPIETAPKDGSNVLLYCPLDGSEYIIVGFWGLEEFYDPPLEFWRDAYNGEDVFPPTHWMPIYPPKETDK